MIMRDKLVQEIKEYESDNQGGRVSKGEPIYKEIRCRASLNTSPEVASAYGTSGEQILHVFTSQALDKEARYFFMGTPYTVRHSSPSLRFNYSILVEVKE